MQNSDLSPLRATSDRAVKPTFWANLRRLIESLLVVGGMAGGGATLGFYAATQIERSAHIAEIERLQASNKMAIDAILSRVQSASESAATATASAASASASAADAAATIGDVVEKVDAAAVKADKAARLAASKVVSVKPPSAAAVQPEVVNQEIRRANERIKEHSK